jgi:hypothetical protein
VGKPNEKEKDLLFSFRKVHINSKITFPAKENTSQHQICPTEISLVFHAKIVLLYDLLCTSFSMLKVSCTDCFARPKKNHKKSKIHPENHARNASIFVPNPYRLYGSILYVIPQQQNISAKISQKSFLWNRAIFPWKTCPLCCSLSSLKHTQKISLNLLLMSTFDISCTLPNAFFYNLKMTFSPQSVFSPSPALDPKAKIRSCFFQDQGS